MTKPIMRTSDIFAGTAHQKQPRASKRVMAHVYDAGVDAINFKCSRCDWESGWLKNNMSVTDAKRGIPCEQCNKEAA